MHRTVTQLEWPYLGGPCPGIIYHSPEFMGLIMNAIFCLLAFRNENKLFTILDAPLLSLFGSVFFFTSGLTYWKSKLCYVPGPYLSAILLLQDLGVLMDDIILTILLQYLQFLY